MDHSIPCSQGVFLVCVDQWSLSGCAGRFTSTATGENGSFRDLARLLMQMEACLNLQHRPQPFCALRQFGDGTETWPALELSGLNRQGALATFHIRIRFRRNASWQGTVTWLEPRKTSHFRSALELLSLMDGALAEQTAGSPRLLQMEG